MRPLSQSTQGLAENIAAISAELHGNRKRYEAFYKKHADRVGGFPGIYHICIDAAKAYQAEEVAATHKHEWLDAIEEFVTELCKLDYCSEAEMRKAARDVIWRHATDPKPRKAVL